MLEVACAVCGAVYQFALADVPVGGKTVTCAKCKARLVVQAPPPPPMMMGGMGDVIDLGGPEPIDLPDDSGHVDLPAPALSRPHADIVDLPAPKLPTAHADIVDLPAPKLPPRERLPEPLTLDNLDLLAPVGPSRSALPPMPPLVPATSPAAPPPARVVPASIPDLPAPKRASAEGFRMPVIPPVAAPPPSAPAAPVVPPFPIPSAHAADDVPDLPAPKYGGPARDLFDDLPAARGPSLADLPIPKRPSGPPAGQAPAPAQAPGVTDLPAPKGFFDDLPRPVTGDRGSTDLPAPKGFFDDLPQPAAQQGRTDLPAPKGFFDDLPQPAAQQGRTDLPAPKGFFDDLPQPAAQQGRSDLPAPKGFFDDLPQPHAQQGRTDLPAPKGFFDDLPQPGLQGREEQSPPGFFDDLPKPGYAASGVDLPTPRDFFDDVPLPSRSETLEKALSSPRTSTRGGGSDQAPPLDLGEDGLSGLDLPDAPPMVAATRTGVVSFRGGSEAANEPARSPGGGGPGDLDLAGPKRRETSTMSPPIRVDADSRKPDRKLRRVALAAALGLMLAGGGGYVMYDRWQTRKATAAATTRDLNAAHKAILAGDPSHWGRALTAAKQVLARSPKHGEALATAALAQLAGTYDQGTNADARIKAGRAFLEQARLASADGPTMVKATAMDVLLEGDAKAAVERLSPLVDGDPEALLYLGWAQLAADRWDEAAATFERTAQATPTRKLAATYGRARALLGKGELDAARAEFLAVIALDAEHVGAQVGVAAAMPAADFLARERELMAILQRPKLDTVDPRVRALAWKLAGNDARAAGRLDSARERYRKALELVPSDVSTLVAGAALEVRDHKYEVAATGIDEALKLAPEDVDANLVKVELDIATGALDAALARLQALRDRKPPISGAAPRAQIELLDGHRLAAAGDTAGALAAYGKAREVLGKGNVAPTIAIATLLGKMAAAADKAGNPADAAALRTRATGELAELAGAATTDPVLAVTLGVAYLDAGGLADAERWLRTAIAARPDDVEARFQLSEVLSRAGRTDEAIATLKGAFDVAPTRVDLGVALARAYEAAGKDADAGATYRALLVDDDKPDLSAKISLDVRIRAGRFFARTGDKKAAGDQGEKILAVEKDNAAGLFLRGEGRLAEGRLLEARTAFQAAVNKDADPQYLDGAGRAQQELFRTKGDTEARDEAIRAYEAASEKAPTMLHPLASAGHLLLHRQDYQRAIAAFMAAYKLAPDAALAGGIGKSYAKLNKRAEAITWLERAQTGKTDAESLHVLAGLYRDADRRDAAIRAYEGATRKGADEEAAGDPVPWLTDDYQVLGDLYELGGNVPAACRAWKAFLARGSTDEDKVKAVKQLTLACR